MLENIANWTPNKNDFLYGKLLIISEDYSKVVKRYGSEDFYYGALIYSVLSLREKFNQHKKQFNEFLKNDLWTATSILKNKKLVENILKKSAFPNKKIKTVFSTAENWNKLNLTKRIRDDENEEMRFEIREEIVKKMYGVGYKFASLFMRMSGYEKIVPVDIWAMKYVESRGFNKRGQIIEGLDKKRYLQYEKKLIQHAKKFDVSPALFQATIYTKFSTWK